MDENKKVDGAGGCCQSAPSDCKCNCNTTISQNQETVNDKIQKLIQAELERAAAIHGDKFHSSHEAYAVLKEEMEELKETCSRAPLYSNVVQLWPAVRYDDKKCQISAVTKIKGCAKEIIAEAVQVAAMCEKYLKFLELEGEENANE